jgi:NitT/TauT family transport system permease protein
MSVTTSTHDDVSGESAQIRPQAREDVLAHSYVPVYNPARSRWKRAAQWRLTVAPPLVLAVILFAAWYMSTTIGKVNSLILPAPADVFASLGGGLSSGLFFNNAIVTIQESVLGFLLALVIALPLGYGLAKSRLISAAVQPYLAAGQAVPAIVIAPFLVFWLGAGLVSNTILCMLVVLFPMVIMTVLGVQTIDKTLTDAARVEGASGWALLAFIEFPLSLPAILAAIRTGFTLSLMGALVGEFVGGGNLGLGALVEIAKEQYDISLMFATIIVLAVLAALYYGATWLLVKLAEAIYF